jgi:hypothetical protein
MSQMIHSAVDLWAAESPGENDEVLGQTMVQFLGWGAPAALLVFLGTKMAHEDILLTANASVSS